ncbi:carboxylesterase family protein [Flammeovirga aprica JL-4]|uniref:Carboxylesterase family protein n=2 Tax=Flammeovirga aprica TaxID=29528 RepID=A0A7X9RV68_9BACT|nr:carboxylesterase family protein [Flammeovirga aprica JL-4]
MKYKLSFLPLFFILLMSFNGKDKTPSVKSEATYKVEIKEDIVYGEGLSHETLNSENAETIPLKLDVYLPKNKDKNRPVYLFFHGGGFKGGSRKMVHIETMGKYFASRGWVFISADYRVLKDKGTVPPKWVKVAQKYPQQVRAQALAIYPALRDAKSAMRWVIANKEQYKINTDYITVGGASAGALTAVGVGISNLEDYKEEIRLETDPTLSTTHLDEEYKVNTIIDLWGTKAVVDVLEKLDGKSRFDSEDPSLLILHGTKDQNKNTLFSEAEALKETYDANGLTAKLIPLEGAGHGAWKATVNGKSLADLSYEFIVEQQQLIVDKSSK